MMPKGPHPDKALSAVRIRAITKPGRYANGSGLYLVVDPSGAKRWVLRTVVRGKRRDIGLGGLRLVSLAEAREEALTYRKLARNGGDPLAERRRDRRPIPTFDEAARNVHAEHSAAWRNAKHSAQWINTLVQYVFPNIGDRRVDQIEAPDVLKVLAPIWLTRPETARRVRQRIGVVLDWAKAAGFREGENPVTGIAKGLPRQPDRKAHHAALPYADVPGFFGTLRDADVGSPVRLAFEFLVLTGARTSEVLAARWSEVDLERETWTIPPERTKTARQHRVPLSRRCLKILADARRQSGEIPHVFPGRSSGKPLSNTVFLMTLRRMGLNFTAHGFRSSFRDWASERTSFPREVCELALGHSVKDKTEAAYRRGDLLDKRRDLMEQWAAFATSKQAEVVPMRMTA